MTPGDPNAKLKKDYDVSKKVNPITYQLMVGGLLYAAIATCPDIAQTVRVVPQFNSKPTVAHLSAVKQIWRYLKATINVALKYRNIEDGIVIECSNAVWADDRGDHYSTSGKFFLVGGGLILANHPHSHKLD